MRVHLVSATAGLILLWAFAIAAAQAPSATTSADFAREATEHFTTQIEAARVAVTNSKDPSVRDFASQLATGYEQASRALVKICQELNIDVSPQPRTAQSAGGVTGAVATASGDTFDNVYTLDLSQALAKAETSFDRALRSPNVEPKLKQFAKQQKAEIQQQRRRIDALAQRQAGESRH
jgi:predicted outer membrane protein